MKTLLTLLILAIMAGCTVTKNYECTLCKNLKQQKDTRNVYPFGYTPYPLLVDDSVLVLSGIAYSDTFKLKQ